MARPHLPGAYKAPALSGVSEATLPTIGAQIIFSDTPQTLGTVGDCWGLSESWGRGGGSYRGISHQLMILSGQIPD